MADVRRLDLGHFVRPASETGGAPRVESINAYVVRRPEGVLLFDTGMGSHPEVDAHYRPARRPLELTPSDVDVVVNCHLHFDHCGGNPRFAGAPIFVQRPELELAHGVDYTLPELVDFAGAAYEVLDGEAEIWPGVWVIPTPGHTAGHQSLVVRHADGTVVLAGHDDGFKPVPPQRILAFDPRRVLFAHDDSVWEP
jgi:glyoxylase-like metal-dependent hydrolase (beta-lactamase superfamily II)